MTNEEFVRRAYAVAEVKDIAGWIACFNPDGVFVDESVGVTYRGPDEVATPVENYGTAFSDMHRELYDVYVSGDVVVVPVVVVAPVVSVGVVASAPQPVIPAILAIPRVRTTAVPSPSKRRFNVPIPKISN